MSIKLLIGSVTFALFSKSFAVIIETDWGESEIFWGLLEADIMISSRFCPASRETAICWSELVTSIIDELKPTEVISTLKGSSAEDVKTKFPSKSVAAPVREPITIILAPGIASPVSESVIDPEIVVCARAIFPTKSMSEKIAILNKLFVFMCLVFICLFTYVW